MANSQQAIKRARQNEKIHARQKGQATAVRTAIKNVEAAVENNTDNAEEVLNNALVALDKAASKGLIHKNKAAREKSRLQKAYNHM